MIIGFTGSQKGWTVKQKETFTAFMKLSYFVSEYHHGNARGADKESHLTVLENSFTKSIHIHPAGRVDEGLKKLNTTFSAAYNVSVVRYAERPPLIRNHDIVDPVDMLIACPRLNKEELRSGTWATIRYARKLKKSVVIINPDGTIGGEMLINTQNLERRDK